MAEDRNQEHWRLGMSEIRALRPEWPEELVQDYFARGADFDELISTPGVPGVTDHNDLENVTPDQHHNQEHEFWGPDHTGICDKEPVDGDIIQYDGNQFCLVPQDITPPDTDCYCIHLCEGVPAEPQSCSSMQDFYLAHSDTFQFHCRAYEEDLPGSPNASACINTSTVEFYDFDGFVSTPATTTDDLGNWIQCVTQPIATTGSITGGAGRAITHRTNNNTEYYGAGDDCTFFIAMRTIYASLQTGTRSILCWHTDVTNTGAIPNDYNIKYTQNVGRLLLESRGLDGILYNVTFVDDRLIPKYDPDTGAPIWVNLVVHVSRGSGMTMTVWLDGVLLESVSGGPAMRVDTILGDADARRYPLFGTAWDSQAGGGIDMLHTAFKIGSVSNEFVAAHQAAWERNTLDYVPPVDPTAFEVGDVLVVSEVAAETGDATWCPKTFGYGGVSLETPDETGFTIDDTWTVLPFDSESLTTPSKVTQLPASNGIQFEAAGVWRVNISFSLLHDDINSGRQMQVQLRNTTQGITVGSTTIGTGRNTPASNYSVSMLADVTEDHLGDLFQIRVSKGTGSDYEVESVVAGAFEANSAGPV